MRRYRRELELVAVLAAWLSAGCLAAPPRVAHEVGDGLVRGSSVEETEEVAGMLVRLRPGLLDLVPDSALDGVEVWVQEEPHLYHFPQTAAYDAEGLYAPAHGRILLSRRAEDVERVLAHELTHAALGPSWASLPGTLEEGLCDCVAARLVAGGAARLRAGRLSSAALACGGIELELDVQPRSFGHGLPLGWSARISLTSEEPPPDAHLAVFQVAAGLSSTRIGSSAKRSYYGLSFLLVERVVERRGMDGLHDLCLAAREQGHGRVPKAWLLRAAELDDEAETWRRAAVQAMGEAELAELVRMYPDFVADALADHLRRLGLEGSPAEQLEAVDAELGLAGSEARLRVTDLGFLRAAVVERLARPD